MRKLLLLGGAAAMAFAAYTAVVPSKAG